MAMVRAIPVVDLLFLLLDRKEAPANVGVAMLFEPPPGRTADHAVREILKAYRATPPTPPFDVIPAVQPLGVPHWQDAGRIDMKRHVSRETLPPPGTSSQLDARLAELHRDMLDRTRPLFEIRLIDGLATGQFVIYIKTHHVSWDGRSAMARIFGTLGTEPGPIRTGFHAAPPAPAPAVSSDLTNGLRALVTQAHARRDLYEPVSRRLATLRGEPDRPRGNVPFGGPHTRLNRPVVTDRTFGRFSLPLGEMRRIGRASGGTINDVLLAVVDDGVQRYLRELGERPPESLVAMCPVSLRDPGDNEARTKATTLFVKLGNPRSGTARRLEEVIASAAHAKAELRGLSREASLDFAILAFGLWLASHAFGLDAITRPVINFVVSNVGGVDGPRYLGRSRLVGAYPVSMLADPTGLNFTTLSHDGKMDVGVIASRDAVPDVEPLVQHCLAAWQRLRRAYPPQDLTLRKPPERKRSRTLRIPPIQRS